jgi:hypothetical protein
MQKVDSRLVAGMILIAGACAGCGGVEREPVEGKITLDGRPLADVHVMFYPQGASATDPTMFFGLTDQQGNFVMRAQADGPEGVPPGRYRVTLTTAVAKQDADETTPLPPERVPAKHRDQEFEVPNGGTTEANFELKSR